MKTALDYASELVKRWEGCRLSAYPDPGTGGAPWTIGWGFTGPGIYKGLVWSQEQADSVLSQTLHKFMTGVRDLVKVPLSANELGALTSLAYNIGIGAFRDSTLLRRLNAGDRADAANRFAQWKRSGGRVMLGLVNRRADERRVFEGGQ